jgi:prevent-host-death family protein
MHVSIAETKARLSAILGRVEQGQEVVVTRRGRPVARLLPMNRTPKPLNLNRLDTFRKRLPPASEPAAETVRRMRDERY